MTNNAFNPFMMPNFGQGASDSATNPLIASMEMMRHAMAGMSAQTPGDATGGGMGAGLNFAQALNPEDIERRISELKVVENWLKLNLSMLTSTIQGLEVQLATIQTLKSFAAMGAQANEASQNMQKAWSESVNSANPANTAGRVNAASTAPTGSTAYTAGTPAGTSSSAHSVNPIGGQSPLEAALGMQPSAQAAAQAHAQAQAQAEQARQLAQETAARSAASSPESNGTGKRSETASRSGPADAQPAAQGATIPPAGQAWWNMLEKQFSQIATATQEAAQVANDAATKAANEATAKFATSTQPQVKAKSKPVAKTNAATKTATKATTKAPTSRTSAKPAIAKRPAKPRAND